MPKWSQRERMAVPHYHSTAHSTECDRNTGGGGGGGGGCCSCCCCCCCFTFFRLQFRSLFKLQSWEVLAAAGESDHGDLQWSCEHFDCWCSETAVTVSVTVSVSVTWSLTVSVSAFPQQEDEMKRKKVVHIAQEIMSSEKVWVFEGRQRRQDEDVVLP